jgi:hypothetical protein
VSEGIGLEAFAFGYHGDRKGVPMAPKAIPYIYNGAIGAFHRQWWPPLVPLANTILIGTI